MGKNYSEIPPIKTIKIPNHRVSKNLMLFTVVSAFALLSTYVAYVGSTPAQSVNSEAVEGYSNIVEEGAPHNSTNITPQHTHTEITLEELPEDIKSKLYDEVKKEIEGEPIVLTRVERKKLEGATRDSCPSGKGELPMKDRDIYTIPVDRHNQLGDFVPYDLVQIRGIVPTRDNRAICLDQTAAYYLKKLIEDAKKDGMNIMVSSGYRSVDTQMSLYVNSFKKYRNIGLKRVAPPESSEHNAGRAVDIAAYSDNGVIGTFGSTKEFLWMKENAYKYGFLQSYPVGKERETGYLPEAWHWSFVGVENAKVIKDRGLTITEALTSDNLIIKDNQHTEEDING